MEYYIHKSHTRAFFLSLFSIYLHLEIRDLENVGKYHDVQYSQWRHSMKNA